MALFLRDGGSISPIRWLYLSVTVALKLREGWLSHPKFVNIDDFYHGGYCIGEETYMAEDGKFHYVKTGRAVDEDVTEEDETED